MMLSLVYYSACRITDHFANAIRADIVRVTDGRYPIVSVTHKPVDFGHNICVGDVKPSAWQVYKNALIGARAATSEFVAMVEDDSLYTREHFTHRPDPGVFAYNRNRWVLTRRLATDGKSREGIFYFRERTQFAQCICNRELLIDALEERFAAYPDPIDDHVSFKMGWGEPGRYEKNLKLRPRVRVYFDSPEPNVTINHSDSIRGRRAVNPDDRIETSLEPWGDATALWDRVHG